MATEMRPFEGDDGEWEWTRADVVRLARAAVEVADLLGLEPEKAKAFVLWHLTLMDRRPADLAAFKALLDWRFAELWARRGH